MESSIAINIYNKRRGLIYSAVKSEAKPLKRGKPLASTTMTVIANLVGLAGVILLLASFLPSLVYAITAGGRDNTPKIIAQTVRDAKLPEVHEKETRSVYEPSFDPNLPIAPAVIIPAIRVNTILHEATLENYEDALKAGVWRVPDFGTPTDRSKPMILAAHRFGYLYWSVPYRLRNSFFSLPDLKDGSLVQIIWRQRKYTYEVYRSEEGEKITDYSADLILYTCENLNSSVRIFKYGRLLEI